MKAFPPRPTVDPTFSPPATFLRRGARAWPSRRPTRWPSLAPFSPRFAPLVPSVGVRHPSDPQSCTPVKLERLRRYDRCLWKEAKMSRKKKKIPYTKRSDSEKILTNWNKTLSLYKKGEYSTSIIRAATAMELTTNLVIRAEFVESRALPEPFVDKLMIWANGISGKMHRLILPILVDDPRYGEIKDLLPEISAVNQERNSVVHGGHIKRRKTAYRTLRKAGQIIRILAIDYVATNSKVLNLKAPEL